MAGTMAKDDLRYRMGCGGGARTIEEGLAWAANHDFHHVSFGADTGANALNTWDDARARGVRNLIAKHDFHLCVHTLSAVNVAEFSPYMSEAVDAYLNANIDLAKRLGAETVIVHGGLHQSSQIELRKQASLDHIRRPPTTPSAPASGCCSRT